MTTRATVSRVSRLESPMRRTPWSLRTIMVIIVGAVIVAIVLAYTIAMAGVVSFAPVAMPVVLPTAVQMRPVENQAQPVQALAVQAPVAAAPAVQPVIVPAASAEWPLVQVEWIPVTDPSVLPPVEQGFYNGKTDQTPWGAQPSKEGSIFARKILPGMNDRQSVLVDVARDVTTPQVVLAGLSISDFSAIDKAFAEAQKRGDRIVDSNAKVLREVRLFLSMDGEGTWREIKMFPETGFGEVRVRADANSVMLFVRETTLPMPWRQATVLP